MSPPIGAPEVARNQELPGLCRAVALVFERGEAEGLRRAAGRVPTLRTAVFQFYLPRRPPREARAPLCC